MDWNLVMSFVNPKLSILIIFVWCIGLFLKKTPKFKSEWLIPFILLGISILFTTLFVCVNLGDGFIPAAIISSIMQGTIIAAIAVFGNEIFKQAKIKRIDDNKPMKGGR